MGSTNEPMTSKEAFREQLAHVENVLIQAEEAVDGFVFTAQGDLENERTVQTTLGTNPDGAELDSAVLLGNTLYVLANQTDTHPAILAHGAVKHALELADRR